MSVEVSLNTAPQVLLELEKHKDTLEWLQSKPRGINRIATVSSVLTKVENIATTAISSLIAQATNQGHEKTLVERELNHYFGKVLSVIDVTVSKLIKVDEQLLSLSRFEEELKAPLNLDRRNAIVKEVEAIKNVLSKVKRTQAQESRKEELCESIDQLLKAQTIPDFYQELGENLEYLKWLSDQGAKERTTPDSTKKPLPKAARGLEVGFVDKEITRILKSVGSIKTGIEKLPLTHQQTVDFDSRFEGVSLIVNQLDASITTASSLARGVKNQIDAELKILRTVEEAVNDPFLNNTNPDEFKNKVEAFEQSFARLERINCNVAGITLSALRDLNALKATGSPIADRIRAKIQAQKGSIGKWIDGGLGKVTTLWQNAQQSSAAKKASKVWTATQPYLKTLGMLAGAIALKSYGMF